MLRIEHLTKTYGAKKAVDDLSLHIQPGQIYGFIGHNGAGKTTTIKACCGILKFDAGEIYVCGTACPQPRATSAYTATPTSLNSPTTSPSPSPPTPTA